MNNSENLLMVADTEHDADMLYAVNMFVPDPFIYLRARGENYIVMSDLEIDRARAQAAHCHTLSLSQYQKKLGRAGVRKTGFARIIQFLLREKRVRSVTVPNHFPLGLANELRRLGV